MNKILQLDAFVFCIFCIMYLGEEEERNSSC